MDIARASDADAVRALETARLIVTEPATMNDVRIATTVTYTVKEGVAKVSYLFVSDSILKVSFFLER